ncbi:ABC transporter ATP-binding protein [Campylobacter lari]|nr:ABC transporter ATP-binding protein [Campylobacter lari]
MIKINIKNLNFSYNQDEVLKNINLNYESKDFLAIVGPNGGGKSTLLKLILGLLNSHKNINFENLSLKDIGYVPQNTLANPNFPVRVLEVVMMGRVDKKFFGFYTKKDQEQALLALEKIGMRNFWDKKINELSGGQRQRVYIARALASECKLLILDEPTASIDTKGSVQIFELLKKLHESGVGVIVICHDLNVSLAYANKIAYLNKELFLHENTPEKKAHLLAHLSQNHTHFCDVELSLEQCCCEGKNHA